MGQGVYIYFGKTEQVLCPVTALLQYMSMSPPHHAWSIVHLARWSTPNQGPVHSGSKALLSAAKLYIIKLRRSQFLHRCGNNSCLSWSSSSHDQNSWPLEVGGLSALYSDSTSYISSRVREACQSWQLSSFTIDEHAPFPTIGPLPLF